MNIQFILTFAMMAPFSVVTLIQRTDHLHEKPITTKRRMHRFKLNHDEDTT